MAEAVPDLKDLIFCPLALPTVPDIDSDQFLAWMGNAHEHKKELGQFQSAEKSGDEGLDEYPWQAAYALSPASVKKSNPWVAGFDKEFPELCEYVAKYPFKKVQTVHFIAQKEQKEVFLHTDRDRWWGMRFYLQNDHGESLYFRKMKKRLDKRPLTWIRDESSGKLVLNDWEKICQPDRTYAKLPENRCPFMISSVRAAHGVEAIEKPVGSKITALIVGEYDHARLKSLLQESAQKFHEYCIWF